MCTIIVLLFLCYHVSVSQPVTNNLAARPVRELIECCPCPDSKSEGPNVDGGTGQFIHAGDLDDCPCSPRSAYTEGASSIFFPSTANVDRTLKRTIDPKEDPKNLLEPEVTLATSMLDTLREATEEYRDALDREAARSAAESDTVPEESARNVVIIVNPRDSDNDDDFIPEASHVQESRCIHPLGRATLSKTRSPLKAIKLFPDSLEFSHLKHHEPLQNNLNHLDSDPAASNVDESFTAVDPNLQSRTPLNKVNTPKKSVLSNNDNTDRFRNPSLKDRLEENSSKILESLKLSSLPKLKSNSNALSNNDFTSAASSVHEQSDDSNENTSQSFRQAKLPLQLKNLLKLRDVELIPKSIRNKPISKPKFDITKFKIPTLLNSNQKENNFRDSCNEDTESQSLENMSNEQNAKIISMKKLVKPIRQSNKHRSNENNLNVYENEYLEDKKENINILPSSFYVDPTFNTKKESTGTVSVEDITNKPNCNALESKETADPSDIVQHEKTQDELPNSKILESLPTITLLDEADDQNPEDILNTQNLNEDNDSEMDSSNNNFTLVPSETQDRAFDILPQNEENCEDVESSPDKEVLTQGSSQNIEEVIPQSLNKQLIANAEATLPLRKSWSSIRESGDSNIENFQPKEIVKDISMNDLQHMSNKLLDSAISLKLPDCDLQSNDDNFKQSKLDSEVENKPSQSYSVLISKENDNADQTYSKNVEEHACLTNLDDQNTQKNKKEIFESLEEKEMDTGASESIANTLGILDPFQSNLKLKSPLLDDIIVKPLGDPLNLLGKPLEDVLNINTNFPTLDNLRERFANIFNLNSRNTEDDSSSFENEYTDESPTKGMVSEASTNSFRKKLPSLQQLDDFNIETFEKKPITTTSVDTLSKIPWLNLHSYRSKIPIPNTLDLKPSNNKPRFGNKARIDTPFKSDKTSARKFNSKNTLSRNFEKFPTLDELRKNLRSNSKNLLNSPINPELNLLTENLRSNDVKDIAETIRLNTEKTMKGIQQKMKSTLRQTKLNSPVSDPFGKPQELLDDMNDKLKAIHYDLNDRISSFHENIKDSTKIKPLNTPSRNVMTNLRQNKIRPLPARLQTDASTITAQVIDPNKYNTKPRDFSLGSEPRNNINTVWNTPQKLRTAPEMSYLTPARTKTPELAGSTLSYLQKTPRPWYNPTLKREPTSYDNNKPIFRTAANSFNDLHQPSKVTISFDTTTPKPEIPLQTYTPRVPKISVNPYEELDSNGYGIRPNEHISGLNHKLTSAGNSKLSSLRYKVPDRSSSNEESDETSDNVSLERRLLPHLDTLGSKSSVKPSRLSVDDENTFLSKIKDAVNKRVSKLDFEPNNKGIEIKSDMVRSHTKSTDIVFDEPLKENVSYRCRMVCKKEFR